MLPGTPAALFMAVTKMPLKASSSRDHALEWIIASANPGSRKSALPRAAHQLAGKITGGSSRNVRSSRGEREQSDDIAAIRWRSLRESIF